jgi:hypothetical protein
MQVKICKEIRFYRNERDKYVRLEIALALRSYDLPLRECLKTGKNRRSRANLQDDQIRTNLPDRPE